MAVQIGSIWSNIRSAYLNSKFFWWAVTIVVPIIFVYFGVKVTPEKVPAIIVAISLFSTAAWSYINLLFPATWQSNSVFGNKIAVYLMFLTLFVIILIFSAGIVAFYASKIVRDDFSPNSLYVSGVELGNVGRIVDFVLEYHAIVFVGLFTLIDLLVLWGSNRSHDGWRRRFSNIIVFIDAPILLGLLIVDTLLKNATGSGREFSFYFFEAGAIAFQLLVGTIFAMVLDVVEDERA
ncbi:hypothetical protein [Phenylobacterium aquaticum]|uniref:hypothetical protein n=1 Tax=Phenylobacterium aquaticum TaxID=1763816 RepID=UPI001F5DF0AC|nr:hypothetical protein [Phenylobacterium aquaticum]MCI3133137.1 hypothetical protein [Phenylobacterium aquaticum]